MSVQVGAHTAIISRLSGPSFTWGDVYSTHETADLDIPSLSVEVESAAPIESDKALVDSEVIDNWNVILSIRVHTGYRLGVVNTALSNAIVDELVTLLRTDLTIAAGFYVFNVVASAMNVSHESSGTTGAEVLVNIHVLAGYIQS